MTPGISNVTYCRKMDDVIRSIAHHKIGFLQEQKEKFSLEDYSLDLATPVTNLTPNAEVKCKIVMKKPGIEIPPMKVSLLKDGKEVGKIAQSDLPLFTLPVLEPGDYEVHAMLQGRHVPGSPLSLPVSSDSTIRDRLANLGLAPLNAKVRRVEILLKVLIGYFFEGICHREQVLRQVERGWVLVQCCC